MIMVICDRCGDEVKTLEPMSPKFNRIELTFKDFRGEIMRRQGFDLCEACISQILNFSMAANNNKKPEE